MSEIRGGEPISDHAVLAGPETATADGAVFSEAHLARHLGEPTVLIDITAGAVGAAEGVRDAAARLDCDLVVYLDVGGDALATGAEPGLGSPLCDATMLAAGLRLGHDLPGVAAVVGAGCDGELTIAEVLGRVAALAAAGAWIGTSSAGPAQVDELEQAALACGTEASMQIVRCARGETGEAEIRGGRRHVPLGPVGALGFYFDLEAAAAELPLATAVQDTDSLEVARETLNARGVSTELDFERNRARAT